jgi:hypothetical protein
MTRWLRFCAKMTFKAGPGNILPILVLLGAASGMARSQDGDLTQVIQELLRNNPAIFAARRAD